MSQGMKRSASLPSGRKALTADDRGGSSNPRSAGDWLNWVSASRTRNYALDDTLMDWLDAFGAARGIRADSLRNGYDPRADFSAFIMAKGEEFETAVMRLLKSQVTMRRIARRPEDTRDLAVAERTFQAMLDGVEVITQAVLRNPNTQTYGAADAIVRSDVLARLFPYDFDASMGRIAAPALGGAPYHYVVVDIKYHTLSLLKDGAASSEVRPYMLQVYLYNEALGRMQGYVPAAAYLLGRNWKQGKTGRGSGPFEHIARVDADRQATIEEISIGTLALRAVAWIRQMRRDGGRWQVSPKPSVPALYPNMKSNEDAPWHRAKVEIAEEIKELTLLPGVGPRVRDNAHAKGLYRWTDPRAGKILAALVAPQYRSKLDGVLRANR